jgi:uncharacterized protein (DUF1800 family)
MNKKIIALLISSVISSGAMAGTKEQQIGLLNKIGYGVTDKSLSIVKTEGIDGWITQQLSKPNFYDDSQIEKKYKFAQTKEEIFPEYKANDFILAGNKTNVEYFYGKDGVVTKSLLKRVDYALNSENRLREMMVWFWFNHFNIGVNANNISAQFINDYEQKIRANSLGNFKDLLKMTSHHPSMLYFLNNSNNRAVKNDPVYGLNENYARELLELHTMGVDSGYSQEDVKELARILTGFSFMHFSDYDIDELKKVKDYKDMKKLIGKDYRWSFYNYALDDFFLFEGRYHDYGDKKFLKQNIKGEGVKELDNVIEILATHPKTARFLSKKMAVYLMNDNPSDKVLEEMTKRYLATGGSIAETLKPLLLSKEFKKSLEKTDKVKDTYTFMLSTMKTAIKNEPGKDKEVNTDLVNLLKYVQADPYYKTTPEGFSIYGKDWLSSARLQENIHFVLTTMDKYAKDKQYPINYSLLSTVADKPIKSKADAVKFLTSEHWLKR